MSRCRCPNCEPTPSNNQQPLPPDLISRFLQFTQEWRDAPQSVLENPYKNRIQQIQEPTRLATNLRGVPSSTWTFMGINFFCTFEHPETREFGYLLERVSLRPLFLNSRCIGYLFFFLLMKYVLRHNREKKSIRRLLWGWGHTSSFNWFLFFCVSSTKLISMRGDLSFLMFCFSFSSHLKPSIFTSNPFLLSIGICFAFAQPITAISWLKWGLTATTMA